MKKNFLLLLAVFAAAMFTGCSNTEDEPGGAAKDGATLTITLTGGQGSRSVSPVDQATENLVSNMYALVFNAGSNALDKKQFFDTFTATTRIEKLRTGAKKVVVVTNCPPALKTQLDAVTNYTQLNDVAMVNLELLSQMNTDGDPGATRLTMTGEGQISLVKGAPAGTPPTNTLAIAVRRVVAKVRLGSITVTPNPGYNPALLTIDRVYLEKVRSRSLLGLNTLATPAPAANHLITDAATPPTLFSYMGGVVLPPNPAAVPPFPGTVSTVVEPRLGGPAAVGATNATWFYVLPNDNTNNNCTLMALHGTYNGQSWYYVFPINNVAITGQPLTGRYIEANHQYTLNITLRNFDGTDNPEEFELGDLDITVTPEDWVVVPTQEVSW